MKKFLLGLFSFGFILQMQATKHVITSPGFSFLPAELKANVGDTISFEIGASHNVVEVSKPTWDAGGSVSNGGFLVPFGGGNLILDKVGIIYYVCEPHSTFGMKGVLTVLPSVRNNGDTYIAKLSGMQEEFPFAGLGQGDVTAILKGDSLILSGNFKNLSGDFNAAASGGAHIHKGLSGTSGGILISLITAVDTTKKSGTFKASSNSFLLTASQKESLLARELYVNIHSTLAPSGEMRGQLIPQADAFFQANLFGSMEVPPVMTDAHGAIFAELNGIALTVSGSAKGLSSGINTAISMGGHLHLGYPGQVGAIQISLVPTLDSSGQNVQYKASNNTFILSAVQLAYLKANQLYANIHTNAYGGGEIRGQLSPPATAKFRVHFSAAQESVPTSSLGTGGLSLALIDSSLTVMGSFNGFESNFNGGSHLHRGMAGQNGGVVVTLKPMANTDLRGGLFLADSNVHKLSAILLDDLFARRLYANVHTVGNTGGELRGQVVPECQYVLFGFFSGMQENKAQISTGKGNVVVEVNGTKLTVSGYAEKLLGKVHPTIGSHLHKGAVGTNGPINITLSMSYPNADSLSLIYPAALNSYTVTAGFLDTLKKRQIYANVHTLKVASGEIRAQLNHEAIAYYHAILSGGSENAPVNTKAGGGVMVEISGGASKKAIVHGSFNGLEGKFNPAILGGAHIHTGLSGANGAVRQSLNTTLGVDSTAGTFLPTANTYDISDASLDSLRKRFFYANVHTTKVASGEIRGNLLNLANAVFTATLTAKSEVPPIALGTGNGAIKAELLGDKLTVTGTFANLIGDFNPNVSGGAHIHAAAAGVNGGIQLNLKPEISTDKKSGRFLADSNSFTLTAAQLVTLNAGGFYANIHTTTSAAGELRGQVLSEPNGFPNASIILTPANNDTVRLDPRTKDSILVTSWSTAPDLDNHFVVYLVQNSVFPDFALVQNTSLAGPAKFVGIPSGVADSALLVFGVPPGGSIRLFSRILSSDGSLCTIGAPSSAVLYRVSTTPVLDAFIKSFNMIVYPSPATERAVLEINAIRSSSLDLIISDLKGSQILNQKINVLSGPNQFSLPLDKLSAGMHFINVYQKGNQIASLKFLKE